MGVIGHQVHILHDLFGIGEHLPVDALDDDLLLVEHRSEDGEIGVVDIAAAEGIAADEPALDLELLCDDGRNHNRLYP